MAEKEAVLDTEEDQDLHSIQTLMKQHEALEVRKVFSGSLQQEDPYLYLKVCPITFNQTPQQSLLEDSSS